MPISPVNKIKNAITPSSVTKGGYALWGDSVVTWGDTVLSWGSPFASMANLAKTQTIYLASEALDHYLVGSGEDEPLVTGDIGLINKTKN